MFADDTAICSECLLSQEEVDELNEMRQNTLSNKTSVSVIWK